MKLGDHAILDKLQRNMKAEDDKSLCSILDKVADIASTFNKEDIHLDPTQHIEYEQRKKNANAAVENYITKLRLLCLKRKAGVSYICPSAQTRLPKNQQKVLGSR